MSQENTKKFGTNENSEIQKSNTDNKQVMEELDVQYVDERTIIISPVKNYSNFRKINIATLGKKKEVIGSSIKSSQILSSNIGEISKYFPSIIGVSPTSPDFVASVKGWLNNIQFIIGDKDVTLDTSFIYDKKSDYEIIQKKEDAINEAFDRVDRTNLELLKKALQIKINALNDLESSKYQYGYPRNIEEYLMYRHCLLYNDVAKDIALINSNPNIRFYIKDKAKEEIKAKHIIEQKKKALATYIKLEGTNEQFDSVFVAICVYNGTDLTQAMFKDRSEKSKIVMDFVNEYPDKFNKLVDDNKLGLKSFIELLIAKGELVRSDYNQQISTVDGTFIGKNINDAVAWFENPANKDLRASYEHKSKMI